MSPAAALALPAERAQARRSRSPVAVDLSDAPHSLDSPTPDPVSRWRASTTGVVFCGGKSSRMGVDKAMLVDGEGRSMLERAYSCLEPLAGEVLLACGPLPRYGELGLGLVIDRRPDGGPLAGLEACLERTTTRWLAVLACDMPRASTATMIELLEKAEAEDLDVCFLTTPAGVEPLCAVYSYACLEPVRAALDAGERRMISFHALRSGERALRIAGLKPRLRDVAQNLNTPEDWVEFQKGAQ